MEFNSGAFETLRIANNRLEILANGQWDVAYKYTTLQVGTKLYLRFDVENFNNLTYIMYNNGSNYLPTNTVLDRKIQKGIVTTNIANSSLQIADANTTFSMRYVYSNHAIDLTSLGISNLTVNQMDYWFSVYQALQSAATVPATIEHAEVTPIPLHDYDAIVYNYGMELFELESELIGDLTMSYYRDTATQVDTNASLIEDVLARLAALEALHQ